MSRPGEPGPTRPVGSGNEAAPQMRSTVSLGNLSAGSKLGPRAPPKMVSMPDLSVEKGTNK